MDVTHLFRIRYLLYRLDLSPLGVTPPGPKDPASPDQHLDGVRTIGMTAPTLTGAGDATAALGSIGRHMPETEHSPCPVCPSSSERQPLPIHFLLRTARRFIDPAQEQVTEFMG